MATVRQTLLERFGFDSLREGQPEVISRLMDGRSTVAIFPTGAGKSLCYQLPALLLDGLTLVVSPLIALMKDQIDFLHSRGVDAARLDSSLDGQAVRDVYQRLRAGTLKLLYVAPERLANERFIQSLQAQPIAMIAVDEAHCISEWGHNFRPDYLRLAKLARTLRTQRVLALTATATPAVARQIAQAFEIDEADVVRTGFYRSNLSLMLTPTTHAQRDSLLLRRLTQRPRGATIVYVTLQKTAERVAQFLSSRGFPAAAYHAGLDAAVRESVQEQFMSGADAIIVATIAFGMGIDKRDIRCVYHYNLPKSLENYAQEIGRAGRDGLDSVCEMLASADDRVPLENFTYGDTPTPEAVDDLARELLEAAPADASGLFDVSIHDLSTRHDIRPLVVETILTYLQLLGRLESVGAFYTEYKFRPLQPLDEAIARFDPARRAFLTRLFALAKPAKIWSRIDLHEGAIRLDEPRERLIGAIDYLAEQGVIEVEAAGARQAYRRTNASVGADDALLATLRKRFEERERRDLERLQAVVDFAGHGSCQTRRLVEHFGETFDRACGHCGWCRGHRPGALAPAESYQFTDADVELLDSVVGEGHDALQTSRQLARFFCGINSPAASRARLGRHAAFGAWAHIPFAQVILFIDQTGGG